MLRWIRENPMDAVKALVGVIAVVFSAGVAYASLDSRIAHLEKDFPPLQSDVREVRDTVRLLCFVTPGCAGASK